MPQTWFQRSAQLYLNGDPVEDAVQCVLVTRSENSAKGNKPLHFGRADAVDLADNADRSLYRLDAKDEPFFSGRAGRCSRAPRAAPSWCTPS